MVMAMRLRRAESKTVHSSAEGDAGDVIQAKIDRAMSAGPSEIARSAKIIDKNAQGRTVVLREGTNGVDGTQELPDIPRIVRAIEGPRSDPDNPRYMTDTRSYRGKKPFFIDKMPNNFRHIGLIHLMLPKAKVIDVRREPMACCFSDLKQLYAAGQEFTYSIEDIARYYKSYLELMRHWDAVLPGRVLRVCYEDALGDALFCYRDSGSVTIAVPQSAADHC